MDAAPPASANAGVGGAVVVFAKCPLAGASKTRLAPLLGADGAAALARAMLSDVLASVGGYAPLRDTLKVLVYAPGTASGESQMASILQSLQLSVRKVEEDTTSAPSDTSSKKASHAGFDAGGWILLPMKSSATTTSNKPGQSQDASKSDLTSSSLGDKLEDALVRVRQLIRRKSLHNNTNEAVLFLGMDSPELPLEEIVYGLQLSSRGAKSGAKAHLCPANDGGYGLLSVPQHAPSDKIFSSVRWSDPLTAVSQLKALTDNGVDVSIGKLMHDIDEPEDVKELAKRLGCPPSKKTDTAKEVQSTEDTLAALSSGINAIGPIDTDANESFPHHTRKALVDMNIIRDEG